jgi:hypothetical protein
MEHRADQPGANQSAQAPPISLEQRSTYVMFGVMNNVQTTEEVRMPAPTIDRVPGAGSGGVAVNGLGLAGLEDPERSQDRLRSGVKKPGHFSSQGAHVEPFFNHVTGHTRRQHSL